MNYFNNCTTLDEAKAEYKKMAMELHPDKGGETAKFQDLLNQFHNFKPTSEKFSGEAAQWNSQEYASIIEALLKFNGITIHICGSWIWLSGNTYIIKDEIKKIETGNTYKRGFSRNKQQWYFSPTNYKKKRGKVLSFEKIQNLYGDEAIQGQGMTAIAC